MRQRSLWRPCACGAGGSDRDVAGCNLKESRSSGYIVAILGIAAVTAVGALWWSYTNDATAALFLGRPACHSALPPVTLMVLTADDL
jgi:hypothetical protein